jgi:hypothetical protein
VQILTLSAQQSLLERLLEDVRGTQFACFAGTKVQILTLSAQQSLLERLQVELAQLEDDKLRLTRELTQQGAFYSTLALSMRVCAYLS